MPGIAEEYLTKLNTTESHAVLAIARACHEANRAYCLTFGDKTQEPWDDAPQWQTTSIINGVAYFLATGAGPQQLHENWCAEKVATGWRYGPVKDIAEKRHPCLVPYSELPADQRAKDHIFQGVIRAVAPALAFGLPPDPERPTNRDALAALRELERYAETRRGDWSDFDGRTLLARVRNVVARVEPQLQP